MNPDDPAGAADAPLMPVDTRASSPAQQRQRAEANRQHGLYIRSENGRRLQDHRVRRLVQRARKAMPWLQPSDGPALKTWARLELHCGSVHADLMANGTTNADGEPRRLLAAFQSLASSKLAHERELGMTPAARKALGLRVRDARDISTMSLNEFSAHLDRQRQLQADLKEPSP